MKPLDIRRLSTSQPDFEAAFQQALHWSAEADQAIEARVSEILTAVQTQGDAAVLAYTARFDHVSFDNLQSLQTLTLTREQLKHAFETLITPAQRNALEIAARRVRTYHERQLQACGQSWSYRDEHGSLLGQKVTPLDRVGIYVPGGKAAYPSSVLMNAIPAQVAGVKDIVMVVPTPRGERNPLVLAAAYVAGVTQAFTIGGAQAIAALAYGTQTIAKVDKITGPGNAYVASAKRRVFGQVGIDMIAGPSEILVLADGTTPADWVAMDLFSQAEHDELAQSILLCPDRAYLGEVHAALDRLLPSQPRAEIIRASLEGRGVLIHTRDMAQACEIANRIAPEHLEISTENPHQWEGSLRHAGAIFLGAYTSESLGDYCAGPNHVLPTSGTARFSSPLGVYDFQKRSSLIEVSPAGAQILGPIAAELADGEGLAAHAQAARLRVMDGQRPSPAPAGHPLPEGEGKNPSRSLELLRPEIRAMHAYTVQSSEGLIKLDAMENPFALPTGLQQALGERLGRVALHRYPGGDRTHDLIAALRAHAQIPTDCDVMLGNGSDELISLLALACATPGATVLAPVPGFVMYEIAAKLQGLRFVGVPLTARFELDAQAMLDAIESHKPTLTYIAYPNNPTANLFDDAIIDKIIAAVRAQNGWVVFDEAYQPFSSRTWMQRMARHDHVLVMRTLSKFGLAGVRLGYLAGPKHLIHEIDKVRPPYNVSVLNTETALFALEHASEYARQAQILREQREYLLSEFSLLQQRVKGFEVFPSQANMILIRVADAAFTFEGLKQRGILVKNVSSLHPLLSNCLRLTVGTPQENALMLEALKLKP